jgi:hypothetical protein
MIFYNKKGIITMKIITTTLTTTAEFSEDGKKRYLLTKVWDDLKPRLAIIMLAPSDASGVELDNTTMLVLNNSLRLGYGSVSVVNLFTTIGNFNLKYAENEDKENIKVIEKVAKTADVIVYASGVGKATNKSFIKRQNQVLEALKPYEDKLRCLSNKEGNARFQHPLSPAVRTWYLSEMKINELYNEASMPTAPIAPIKESKSASKASKKISSP